MLLELDQPDKASKAAQEALFALKSLDGDLTVSAIRGGAAAMLYSVAGIGRGDLAEIIAAQDNAGAWWRAQDVSWALDKDLELRFKSWAGDTSTHFVPSSPNSRLTSAAWNAAFSGAWGAWRHLSTQISQLTLTVTRDPMDVTAGLTLLAFAGEKAHAKIAARRIWMDGPASALQAVVNALATSPWSKRAEGPAMGVLASAGDLLAEEAADIVVERVLSTLNTDGPIRHFGGGWTDRWTEVHATLRRLLKAASASSHQTCANLIVERFSSCPESVAASLVRLAPGLRLADVSDDMTARLVEVATDRNDHYSLDLLEVLGPASDQAEAELRKRAKSGSEQAFRSLLVAGSDEHGDYLALGRSAARTVKQMVIDARGENGTSSFATYANDQLNDLAIAAFHTGDNRLWKTLTDALEAGVIAKQHLQRAVQMLARQFPKLPPHVQRKLRRLAPNLNGANVGFGFDHIKFSTAVANLNIAAGNVSDQQVEGALLALRRTDTIGFVSALASWNGANKLPFLATMVVDSDAQVRSEAAYSLIEHAYRFPVDAPQAASVVRTALTLDAGCRMPDAGCHRAGHQRLPFGDVRRPSCQPERPPVGVGSFQIPHLLIVVRRQVES